jgi:hypothetical protein
MNMYINFKVYSLHILLSHDFMIVSCIKLIVQNLESKTVRVNQYYPTAAVYTYMLCLRGLDTTQCETDVSGIVWSDNYILVESCIV